MKLASDKNRTLFYKVVPGEPRLANSQNQGLWQAPFGVGTRSGNLARQGRPRLLLGWGGENEAG
jgi:hypothetical protein